MYCTVRMPQYLMRKACSPMCKHPSNCYVNQKEARYYRSYELKRCVQTSKNKCYMYKEVKESPEKGREEARAAAGSPGTTGTCA